MQITIIPQQFQVEDQSFDTAEEAQAYIDSNADRLRVSAFVEHLKAGGKQRIGKAITDAIEQFIAFEAGNVAAGAKEPVSSAAPASSQEGTAQSAGSEKSTSPATNAGEELGKSSGTESTSAQTAEQLTGSETSAPETKGHVDGPDADALEDPLAGLDV